jgi:hypothetical protein
MTLPFRNTEKIPSIYLAPSVVSIFDTIEDAEAAVIELDEAGFGKDLVYARGESARKLDEAKTRVGSPTFTAPCKLSCQTNMASSKGTRKR